MGYTTMKVGVLAWPAPHVSGYAPSGGELMLKTGQKVYVVKLMGKRAVVSVGDGARYVVPKAFLGAVK